MAKNLCAELKATYVAFYFKEPGDQEFECIANFPQAAKPKVQLLKRWQRRWIYSKTYLLSLRDKAFFQSSPKNPTWVVPYLSADFLEGWILVEMPADSRISAAQLASIQDGFKLLAVCASEKLYAVSTLQTLKMFADISSDGIGIACALSDVPIYINPAGRRILNIPEDLDAAKVDPVIFRRSSQLTERERILKHVREHGRWSGETLIHSWDGEPVPLSETVMLFPFAATSSGWALSTVFKDLRAEHQHEQGTKLLAEFMQKLSQGNKEVYFIYDLEQQRVFSSGAKLANMLGYTEEEILHVPGQWSSLLDEKQLSEFAQLVRKQLLKPKSKPQKYQIMLRHKNGQWETAIIVLSVLLRSATGSPLKLIGRLQLITHIVGPTELLRRQEALFHQIVDEMGDSVLVVNQEGVVNFANHHAEKTWSQLKQSIGKINLSDLLHVSIADLQVFRTYTRSSRIRSIECEIVLRNGKHLNAELRYRCLDEKRILCIIRDLSRDAQLADATHKQTAYYRGLFQNNTSGAVIFDDQLRILAVNPALTSLLRYLQYELVGKLLIDIVAAGSVDEAKEHFLRMRHDRHFNKLFRHGLRILLRRKDGRILHTQAALTAISDGVVLFNQGIAIFTDVSQEEMVRAALDRQARFNETLVTHIPASVLVLNPEGKIVRINPALEKLLGYRMREVVGKTVWTLPVLEPTQMGIFRDYFKSLSEGENTIETSLRMFTKSDGIRIVNASISAARDAAGHVLYIIATLNDITEEKRLEAEVIRVAEQEQMRIGNDLHDGVGQTLTGILSLTEAIQFTVEEKTLMFDELDRIRGLVKDAIVQVRQLSHGLSPAAVKHRGLAASLGLMAERMNHQRVKCLFILKGEPIFQDPEAETHLYRLAQEAVNNAMKHAQPKKITITLKRESKYQGCIEIADDGIGVSSKIMSRREGIGIRVMQYRTNLIAGEFSIQKQETGGTIIRCRFPCQF